VNATPPAADPRAAVASIRQRPHGDVLVIGGGINGIAIMRDLALQGVDVILLERGDYASGASSASSHMIHGGIRYLENGEFRLVRESVRERNMLLRTAPHYVKPLRTTIPIFSTFSGILAAPSRFLTHRAGHPRERGALLIKVGLWLYDSFSRDGGRVPRHRFLRRTAALAQLPRLNPRLKYTASYTDASVHNPERLALDLLRDGLETGHARAANYVAALGADSAGVQLVDRETGAQFSVSAPVVINATGPWTDVTNEVLGVRSGYMGGTKGSHIVIDNDELLQATGGREIFFEHSDGRIVLIYPLAGRVLVGTTDLEADIRQPVSCTDAEIDYFFELIGHVFPDVRVDRSDIVFAFAGVRPLPKHSDTEPGFVSRDYRVVTHPDATPAHTTLVNIVGGKFTTFRALAERVTDDVLALLERTRRRSTRELAIGGGAGYPTTDTTRAVWLAAHGDEVGRERASLLLDRYGTRAAEVIDWITSDDDAELRQVPGYTRAEIERMVAVEAVAHVSDVVLRRTNLAFLGRLTTAAIEEVADVLAQCLGWPASRRRQEIADVLRELEEGHRVVVGAEAKSAAQPTQSQTNVIENVIH
jgi:glycerol-3-phosphate dehydrogenase